MFEIYSETNSSDISGSHPKQL